MKKCIGIGFLGSVCAACACVVASARTMAAQMDVVHGECARLAAEAEREGNHTILGRDGWMYFAPELRHLGSGRFWGQAAARVSRAAKPEFADPLPAIVDFHDQLKRAGVELLVVPVPPKAVIYPEHIFPAGMVTESEPRIDMLHQRFYEELRSHGVNVLDLVPVFLEAKAGKTLYCRQDTHWSGAACIEAARVLKEVIAAEPWYASLTRRKYAAVHGEIEISGDLRSTMSGEAPAKEKVAIRYIQAAEAGDAEPVAPDPASPVVLLGDSHNLVFHAGGDMHAAGAGLADQLAFELGLPVDLIAVRGSGATPARVNMLRRARNPSYLAGKKIVVWCFSAREFTESTGWMKVPVVK